MSSPFSPLIKSKFDESINKEVFSYFFAAICIFLIPFYTFYTPPFLILWLIFRVLEIRAQKNQNKPIQPSSYHTRTTAILFAVFFILQCLSLLYTRDISKGLNIIFSRLSFFIFPLLFFFPGKKIQENHRSLLEIFAIGTVLFIVYSLIYAAYRSVSFIDGELLINIHPENKYWLSYFSGSDFSVNQHPSYTAIFVVFSIIIAFDAIFVSTGIKRFFWIVSVVLFIISIYLLSSRSGFLIAIITIPVYFSIKLLKNKKIVISAVFLILVVTGGVAMIKTNERMKFYMGQISEGTFLQENSGDSRILIWKSGLNVIRENLLIGVGVGDVREELMKQYLTLGDMDLISSHYNAHNQYIEIAIEGGIISLISFIALLGYIGFLAVRERDLLLTLFILMIVISFLFETILYRLAGIMFVSLITFVLLQNIPKNKSTGKLL